MKGPAGEARGRGTPPSPFLPGPGETPTAKLTPAVTLAVVRTTPPSIPVNRFREPFPQWGKKGTSGRVTDREGLGETSARNRERGKTQQGKRDTSSSRNVPDKGEEVKVVGAAIAYEECRFPFQLGKNLPVALASFCFRRECCPNVYKEMRELIGAGKRNKQKSVSPQLRVFSPLVYAEVRFFFPFRPHFS